MTGADEDDLEEVASRLATLLGVGRVTLRPLTSGTSRQTFAVAAEGQDLILQRRLPGDSRTHLDARHEAELLAAVAAADVPVPRVVASSLDPAVLGGPFVLTERLTGETIPRKILRDPELGPARSRLAFELGAAIARMQAVTDLPPLPQVDPLEDLRSEADALHLARPALEIAFAWLTRNRPAPRPQCLVHGDLRLGNLIVDPTGVVAILDWELAHRGDPAEDLGWLCVPSWRFGQELPVGGVGPYDQLLDGYGSVRPDAVPDRATLRWWEVLGTLRWGIICGRQAQTFLDGEVASHELAVIGRRISETESDLLTLTGTAVPADPQDNGSEPPAAFDIPSAADLLTAVDSWLGRLDLPADVAYQARVARTVLNIAAREATIGSTVLAQRREAVTALGLTDERALAAAIRSGARPDDEVVRRAVARITAGRLAVNDPGYRGASAS